MAQLHRVGTLPYLWWPCQGAPLPRWDPTARTHTGHQGHPEGGQPRRWLWLSGGSHLCGLQRPRMSSESVTPTCRLLRVGRATRPKLLRLVRASRPARLDAAPSWEPAWTGAASQPKRGRPVCIYVLSHNPAAQISGRSTRLLYCGSRRSSGTASFKTRDRKLGDQWPQGYSTCCH